MQIKELKNEKLKREYSVSWKSADVDTAVTKKLEGIAKTARIDGFRPGKVPLPLIRQRHGAQAREEALSALVQEATDKIVADNKVTLAERPNYDVKEHAEGKDFTLEIKFEVLPEIKELKLSDLKFDRYTVKVDAKEVEKTLKGIAERHAEGVPSKAKRATKKGDMVRIDFEGRVDGELFEGGAAKGHDLELGSGAFIPGFEDQLIGKKPGDDVLVKVTFPKEYSKPLAGKDAEFAVKIHDILEQKVPTVDKAFAEKLGFKSLDDLKKAAEESIEKEYDGMSYDYAKQDVLDFLADHFSFDCPEGMVDREYHSICHRLMHHEGEHLSEKDFKKKSEEWKAEYYPIAERRVKLGLVLAKLAKDEKLRVAQKELENAILQQAYARPSEAQQIMDYYKKNPQAVESLRAPILEEKVIHHVLDKAKITEKPVDEKTLSDMLKKREEEMEGSGDAKKSAKKKK